MELQQEEKPESISIDQRNMVISMQKLSRKISELELFERMTRETKNKYLKNEENLSKEKNKLDQQQYEQVKKVEAFCDEVWKFAASCDLYASFNKYLDIPAATHWKFSGFDIELDPDVAELKTQNDTLKTQLANKRSTCQKLEKNLVQLNIELQIAESYRDKSPEIIRLRKRIEECEENVDVLHLKIGKIELEHLKDKQPLVIGNGNKKYDFVTASELLEKSQIPDAKKCSKFSVKKQSSVARKLANGTKRFVQKPVKHDE